VLLLHALYQKLRPRAQFELLGCELLRLFCSNSHPSNSNSASHRGKAETGFVGAAAVPLLLLLPLSLLR
jgi:hypothetical protein